MFRKEVGKHNILIGSYKSSWTTLHPQTICCNETAQPLEVIKSESENILHDLHIRILSCSLLDVLLYYISLEIKINGTWRH